MRALIWKEWREKRMWLVLLAISTVMVVVLDVGYTFVGEDWTAGLDPALSGWCFVSVVLALFMGAGAFVGELDRSAQFLLSRPVSWKKLVLAKVVVGLAIIFCAAIAAAIAFRILVPEQYARFATFGRIASGVGYAVALMGVGYFAGLVCSASLPGTIGGVLVLVIIYAAMVAETVFWQWGSGTRWYPQWSVLVGWPLGALAALIVTARFGLTLPAGKRLLRYLVIPAATALVLLPMDFELRVTPESLLPRSMRATYRSSPTSFGPDVRYAVAPFPGGWYRIVNRWGAAGVGTGSRQIPVGSEEGSVVFNWAAPGTVYDVELVSKRTAAGSTEPQNRIEVFRLDKRLNLHESMIPVLQGYASGAILIPSPSGRRVLVVPSRTMRHISPWIRERSGLSQVRLIPESGGWEVDYLHGWHTVDVVDISASRVLATRQLRAATLWWQSEDEIGYLDRDGRRHIVQLR